MAGASTPAKLLGLVLLALAVPLWRGSRAAAGLGSSGLLVLAAVTVLGGADAARHVHPLSQLAHATLGGLARASAAPLRLGSAWLPLADVLIGGVLAVWLLVLRSPSPSPSPASAETRHDRDGAMAVAREIVERHGEDSIAPFILRPDKSFHFTAGSVLAYRVFGDTAVVSGDPVGPPAAAGAVLASFLRAARERGWKVVLYGASTRHLDTYRSAGLRALCVGEEAIADPGRFTLEGRSVRKLRQSVNRIERRGWSVTARDGREIDVNTESEIDRLEVKWRAARPRLIGFTMGMGAHEGGVHAGDLYLLARSPEGHLAATMRFITHRGKLSLDTMRRVGETPNGLNEALVCRALEVARARGVKEVSLNYAGLAHLIRHEPRGNPLTRRVTNLAVAALGRRFQMERLVRFNEKFTPEWRPRYLVYQSRRGLPLSVLRVLQAEGYVPAPRPRLARAGHTWPTLPLAPTESGVRGR